MSQHAPPTSGVVPVSTGAGYTVGAEIKTHVDSLTIKALTYFIGAVLLVFVGVGISVFWDLSGRVNQMEGQTSVSKEIYEFKLGEMTKQNQELQRKVSSLECLLDENVKDKGACRR